MPALRFSKSDATIATPSSPANSLSAEVDLPGISSASSKFLWSSVWQKYWERKSSGRQTIPAPFLAASRMKSRAREKFFSESAQQRICTSATFVLSCVMSTEVETALNVSETVGDSSTSLGMTRGGLVHRTGRDDVDLFDRHAFRRFAHFTHAIAAHRGVANFCEHVVPFDQFAERCVLVIESRHRRETNEELRTSRIRIGLERH